MSPPHTSVLMTELTLDTWRGRSVLKGDDGVDLVHVVRSVPEDSGEVVCVGGVVHLDLVTKASVFGEGVHLPFVINHLAMKESHGSVQEQEEIRKRIHDKKSAVQKQNLNYSFAIVLHI